jgi:hypothetical protein
MGTAAKHIRALAPGKMVELKQLTVRVRLHLTGLVPYQVLHEMDIGKALERGWKGV